MNPRKLSIKSNSRTKTYRSRSLKRRKTLCLRGSNILRITSKTEVYIQLPESIVLSQDAFVDDFMSQRHNLEMWKQISHVTAMLNERDDRIEEYRFRYIFDEHKDDPLFARYRNYIMQLSDNYSFAPVLADRELQHHAQMVNTKTLCLMQAFKIAWFMSIFANIHIDKMMVVFIRLNRHQYFIMDIRNVHWRSSNKSLLNRVVMQRIVVRDNDYTKQHLSKITSDAYKEDESIVKNVEIKRQKLDDIYEGQKRDIDLDLYKKEPVDNRSDQAFALFHPSLDAMNIKLSDMTDGNVEIEGVKKYFMDLYGTHSYIKKGKLEMLGNKSNNDKMANDFNKDANSRYRINSASAKNLITREKKGEVYQSPFSPSIVSRKQKMLRSCTRKTVRDSQVNTKSVNKLFELQFK